MFSVLCCFWAKSGHWSFLHEKHHHLREVIRRREMPNTGEAQKMGTTEVGLKSRYKPCVCGVDACETKIQGQNTWMHTSTSIGVSTTKPWSFWSGSITRNPCCLFFFPLQSSYFNLGSTHQFMTDIFTLFFFRCWIYIKIWSLSNNTSAMVMAFRIMLNEPFSCPTVSYSKNQELKSLI